MMILWGLKININKKYDFDEITTGVCSGSDYLIKTNQKPGK